MHYIYSSALLAAEDHTGLLVEVGIKKMLSEVEDSSLDEPPPPKALKACSSAPGTIDTELLKVSDLCIVCSCHHGCVIYRVPQT